MGEDGKVGGLNQPVARDEVGFNLNYFTGDYSAINNTVNPFPGHTAYITNQDDNRPLFNGNISSMAFNIKKFASPGIAAYHYDQLNRITARKSYYNLDQTNNTWSGLLATKSFEERFKYDANGNILNADRYTGQSWGGPMDSLTYSYYTGTNRLRRVRDLETVVYHSFQRPDLSDQSDADNYKYDSIGNLISDTKEGLTSVKWSVYGKILEINRTSTTDNPVTKISYTYDAAGNRISKKVSKSTTANIDYTWYVRDAQGNLMHTYTATGSSTNLATLNLISAEQPIYGSSRLGMVTLNGGAEGVWFPQSDRSTTRGMRQYELSNHLGNVLATISDSRTQIQSTAITTQVDHFEAMVMNAFEYYAFGMIMPDRKFVGPTYRYGFNGKENDNEVKGFGNEQDYGMRIYDPRVSRFLSVDPLTKRYPWYTPYQFAGNKPLWATDLDGLEENTASTYVYHTPPLAIKFAFRGTISFSGPGDKGDEKYFEGTYGQLYKRDERGLGPGIVNALIRSNIGDPNSKLDIKVIGTRSEFSKTWKGTDLNYYHQFSYSLTTNGVTEKGTFEANTNTIEVSARAWDPLLVFLVNRAVSSIVLASATGGETIGIQNMRTFVESATAESKNGMSEIGRALQKHVGRAGSSFSDLKFSAKTATKDALNVLKDIFNSENKIVEKAENGTLNIFDKVTGRGVNISRGGLFNGFRDLKEVTKPK
jgi:RHS repeat-associated protein